jgi:zinc/manganese transport system ATP-binding protein
LDDILMQLRAPRAGSLEPHASGEVVAQADHLSVVLRGRPVLEDVNFSIKAGEFVAVIGPNGAGKSTLLRVLLGLITPTSGSVHVLGRPVARGNPRIGYVPQHQTFYESTPLRARDMVALGVNGTRYGPPTPNREGARKVQQALEDVRATTYADMPIARLSGGEQQRLMLAQALVGDPELLLLDEPLANLDIRSRRDVVDLVRDISRARRIAVLFVAHDVNPLLGCMDRVLYIANGHAVIGPQDEIVRSEVLSDLFGFPVHVIRAGGHVLVSTLDGDECH